MNAGRAPMRVAVIDTDSGFIRVLSNRMDAAGWRYRVLASGVPPEELVAMKINAVVFDPDVIGEGGWEYLERICGMLPDLGVIVCANGAPFHSGSAGSGSGPTTGSTSPATRKR